MKTLSIKIGTILVAAAVLSGCSSLNSVLDNKVDYRSGSDNLNRNPLEVPPDLTRPSAQSGTFNIPGATTYTDISNTQKVLNTSAEKILPQIGNARLVQDGAERWLTVDVAPEKVWPQLREFWLNQGFALEVDNPSIGIMETDWLENRAKLPQDWVRKLIGKVIDNFMSTGEMDKFRTRIERNSSGGTDIFLTHRGMLEVFKDDGRADKISASHTAGAQTIWTPRKADPELEAEMLSLMLQQLGVKEEVAKAVVANPQGKAPQAAILDNQIILDDGFDRAWRRVGLALDRIGYVVIDRNRDSGVYYVRRAANDIQAEQKTGFFSGLFGGGKKDNTPVDTAAQPEFEVHVASSTDSNKTAVTLSPRANASSVDPQAILSRLLTELK